MGQALGTLSGVILAVELIATHQQPVHIAHAPATGICTHQGARALVLVQGQGLLRRFHQRLQGLVQLRRALEEPIDNHFLIARSQHAAQLATASIALLGKIAEAFKSRFGSTRHATPIHIQNLKVRGILMAIPLTVLAINAVQRLFHLAHILGGAAIQRFLHHRLLGTTAASEGCLQRLITAQAGVDFDQPMRSGQQANEGIVDFVDRCMLDCLLGNTYRLADWAKHVQLPQFDAHRRQTRTPGKMFRDRLVHDDDPPISDFTLLDRYDPSSLFWQVPFCWQHPAASLDKI